MAEAGDHGLEVPQVQAHLGELQDQLDTQEGLAHTGAMSEEEATDTSRRSQPRNNSRSWIDVGFTSFFSGLILDLQVFLCVIFSIIWPLGPLVYFDTE